jgi:hypothetical protein
MLSRPGEEQKSEYGTLLARVKEGDLSVDFQRLRFSYMESPERRVAKEISHERAEMVRAMGSKDFARALELSSVVLTHRGRHAGLLQCGYPGGP